MSNLVPYTPRLRPYTVILNRSPMVETYEVRLDNDVVAVAYRSYQELNMRYHLTYGLEKTFVNKECSGVDKLLEIVDTDLDELVAGAEETINKFKRK